MPLNLMDVLSTSLPSLRKKKIVLFSLDLESEY